MKMKNKKRKTVQIRICKEWHNKIQKTACSEKITMSLLLDEICEYYFSNFHPP